MTSCLPLAAFILTLLSACAAVPRAQQARAFAADALPDNLAAHVHHVWGRPGQVTMSNVSGELAFAEAFIEAAGQDLIVWGDHSTTTVFTIDGGLRRHVPPGTKGPKRLVFVGYVPDADRLEPLLASFEVDLIRVSDTSAADRYRRGLEFPRQRVPSRPLPRR